LPEGEVTARYARKLEEVITKKPEDWLWSHRRWIKSF
jgi:KDO2-lipid IV(A) lauroyltransferase